MTDAWITVFGGTGYLGRRIVGQLLAAGHPVRIAARRPALPPGLETSGDRVQPVRADLHDAASIRAALDGARAVVNAVSLYVEGGGRNTFEAVHVRGAERLAEAARQGGVERLVHLSGLGVDTGSASAYVRARAWGEQRVSATFPGATLVRPSVLFGPDDALLSALSRLTALPLIPLFGRGETRLQPVFVEDVARAIGAILDRDDARGRVYELGGPAVYRYRDLVNLMLRHRARRRPLVAVPFGFWRGLAAVATRLPGAPLTRDQVILMQTDNRVAEDASGFEALNLTPRSVADWLVTGV